MNDYITEAMRTAAPLADNAADFAHAALGLADEMQELKEAFEPENVKEELGDLLWFSALASVAVNGDVFASEVSFPPDLAARIKTDIDFGDSAIHPLVSMAKRWFAYGKEPDTLEALQCLVIVVAYVRKLARAEGWTLEEVQQANIAKLKARYPEKFDSDKAINRDTDAERAVVHIRTMPIEKLELTVRTTNYLKAGGVHLVGDLLDKGAMGILKIGGIGRKSLRDIEEALSSSGITLSMLEFK